MRKVFLVLLAAAALFMTACQATPEKPVVVRKNTEKRIGEAKEPSGKEAEARDIAARVRAPEEYQYGYASNDGTVKVSVDAVVSVPEGGKMPVARVRAANFTQEQASAFYDALVGGAQMYEPPAQRTRAEIEEAVVSTKREMARAQQDGDDGLAKYDEQAIRELEAEYETAPETVEKIPTGSTLREMDVTDGEKVIAHYTGIKAVELLQDGTWGKSFFVSNNSDLGEPVAAENGQSTFVPYRNAQLSYSAGRELADATSSPADETPAQAPEGLAMTPAQARQEIEAFLERTGTPMAVSKLNVLRGKWYSGPDKGQDGAVYEAVCVRTVDGVPCAGVAGVSETGGGAKDAASGFWVYETMTVGIDDKGILNVEWESPIEVVETETEDAKLLQFPEIQGIFEKMMPIEYGFRADEEEASLELSVDRAELVLMRVAEQDSIENGLLVPVWRFCGTRTRTLAAGAGEAEYACILTVNAIDGSVIDPGKGY